MADIGHWRPAKGTHAIQVATIAIGFAENVNDKPWRRIEELASTAAQALSISERQPVQMFQMHVQATGSAPTVGKAEVAGVEFIRRVGGGTDAVAEKLQVLRNSISYENWSYTRWAPMKERAAALLRSSYGIFCEGVELASLTTSYVDGFHAIVPQSDADCSQIIDRKSKAVTLAAFNRLKPWHCHSGWFEYPSAERRRLKQINIDIGDATLPDGTTRVAQVGTNIIDQFNQPGLDRAGEHSFDELLDLVQSAHVQLKGMLGSVLTKDACNAISLKP